jgi:hypothetical protein
LEKMTPGMQAKSMLLTAGEIVPHMKTEALILVQKGIDAINGLAAPDQDRKTVYRGENFWENPDNFVYSSGVLRIFSVLGGREIEETLLIASRFKDNSMQMRARLATIEPVLKKGPPKPEKGADKDTKKKTTT